MTAGRDPAPTQRVGFFGKLGAGNYGNDGSLEALLTHVRQHHPSVPVDCMAAGPEVVQERYGIPAVDLSWDRGGPRTGLVVLDRVLTALRVGVGVGVDAYRIARWTRRHSVAIVPGMGTFESTMQVRPWQTPWSLFALATSARVFGVSHGHHQRRCQQASGPAHPRPPPPGALAGEPPVLPGRAVADRGIRDGRRHLARRRASRPGIRPHGPAARGPAFGHDRCRRHRLARCGVREGQRGRRPRPLPRCPAGLPGPGRRQRSHRPAAGR